MFITTVKGLTKLSYQEWVKWESERNIINALYEGDRSFTDLVELTYLSKPVLSRRLKELKKEGKIKIVPETETKRFLYHLIRENLDTADVLFIKMYVVSKGLVSSVAKLAKDTSISDREYDAVFQNTLSMLLAIKMDALIHERTISELDIHKAWLKSTFGSAFVKNLSELNPDIRKTSQYTAKRFHPKALALFKAKDAKEIQKRLHDFYDYILKRRPSPKQESKKP